MRRSEREITDPAEIEEIFRNADVCRVAFADNDHPYIVTMNFGYSTDEIREIFFHCAREGRKMEMIKRNNHVCFEMDIDHELYSGEKACNFGMKYRSVVGWGLINLIEDREEKIRGLNRIMAHYSGEGDYSYDDRELARVSILKLDITEMKGKKSL